MKIILKKDFYGRWFGRIVDSDDGHGNEIDCYLYTPQQALESLLTQWEEKKKEELKDDSNTKTD